MADSAFETDYVKKPAYPRPMAGPAKGAKPASVVMPPKGAKMVKRPDPAALAAMLRMFAKGATGAYLNRDSRKTGNNP